MRRAFTLVEVTVIVTVIAIIAALAVPQVVAMARGRERDEQYNDILRLAQLGREAAIRNGQTYVLTIGDSAGSMLTLAPEDDQAATSLKDTRSNDTATTSSSGGTNNNNFPALPQGAILGSSGMSASGQQPTGQGNNSDDLSQASATIPEGATIGQLNLGSQSSSTSDFKLHFYPEGRSEGGGFEIVEGSTTRTLLVDINGFASLKEATLPPAAEQSWEAGTYEQRASS